MNRSVPLKCGAVVGCSFAGSDELGFAGLTTADLQVQLVVTTEFIKIHN